MHILGIIIQSWLLFSMVFFAITKLTGAKHQVELFDSIKLPQWFRVVTGLVQLIGAVGLIIGYWYPGMAGWAGVWIGITMFFAILSHLRVKHTFGKMFPAILNLVIAAAVILLFAEDLAHPFG
ncbi:DoxX family protein [Paenibacillus sp. JDR-2]|uniref:DoxX family protein n=1 Tax=Paenibacillus sp. (strain JDR-2) TaxID=324057 RepID=UPI000166A77F|nr:DoxX family protein [Paenibacillus sp. JDR-2]ACT00377.1 DoxX family protein [Paenibacillus sp. JDR-2]